MPVLPRAQPFQLILHINFDVPYNIWTGDGNLTFDGKTYVNSEFNANEIDISAGQKGQRLTLTLPAVNQEDIIRYTNQDPGPRDVELSMIWRESHTDAWQKAFTFIGKLSDPYIQDGLLTVECETYTGDVDRGLTRNWSDADQKARFTGDRGLEAMPKLAEQGLTLSWPP